MLFVTLLSLNFQPLIGEGKECKINKGDAI